MKHHCHCNYWWDPLHYQVGDTGGSVTISCEEKKRTEAITIKDYERGGGLQKTNVMWYIVTYTCDYIYRSLSIHHSQILHIWEGMGNNITYPSLYFSWCNSTGMVGGVWLNKAGIKECNYNSSELHDCHPCRLSVWILKSGVYCASGLCYNMFHVLLSATLWKI